MHCKGFSADTYEPGDNLFIWAKSGLNVRKGPGTNFKVISKIAFGGIVTILEKCQETYNLTGISSTSSNYLRQKVDPIIFKGNWVKVMIDSEIEGYIIDQYLLDIEPKDKLQPFEYGLNLKEIRIDTTVKSPILYEGSGLNLAIEKQYPNDIKLLEQLGGTWEQSTYVFPNYSIEEVLIFFSAYWDNYENFVVYRNWKEHVIIGTKGICDYQFKKDKNRTVFVIECSN